MTANLRAVKIAWLPNGGANAKGGGTLALSYGEHSEKKSYDHGDADKAKQDAIEFLRNVKFDDPDNTQPKN